MTEERARHYAKALAQSMGLTIAQPTRIMGNRHLETRAAGWVHRHRPRGQPRQPARGVVPAARPVGADLRWVAADPPRS